MPPPDALPSPAISETDMNIFRRLCNPQKVDLSGEPSHSASLSPLPASAKPSTSTFARALHTPAFAAAPAPAPAAPAVPPPPPSFREDRDRGPRTPVAAAAPEPSTDPSFETHRRHANLLHLRKMEQMGTRLTRTFTMDDSSETTQFEIDFQENNQAVTSAVGMMKGAIGFGFLGLEMANAKFGPFLNLNGLSTTACQDMNRYNQPLERLYRRFFRKKAMSPVMELLTLIVGTIFATHIGNKGGPMIKMLLSTFMGGAAANTAPESQHFSQRGFDPRNLPATPAPAPAPAPAPVQPESRKTLRRPGSVKPATSATPAPPPPPPPAPRFSTSTAPTAIIFPVAGTPLRGMRGGGSEPPIMSLPTVIEEITEPEPAAAAANSDLDRDTFERLMKEVQEEA